MEYGSAESNHNDGNVGSLKTPLIWRLDVVLDEEPQFHIVGIFSLSNSTMGAFLEKISQNSLYWTLSDTT